jgi:hypothetical protein
MFGPRRLVMEYRAGEFYEEPVHPVGGGPRPAPSEQLGVVELPSGGQSIPQ